MLIVGSCVRGDGGRFKEVLGPSLEPVLAPEDMILCSTGDVRGIAAVYNDFVREARRRPDCDGLVLLHDDVQVVDSNFRAKVLAALREEDVGVVGPIGGAALRSLAFWEARRRAGRVFETRGLFELGPVRADVDVVDGLMIGVSPRAFQQLMFDEETCPRFHGYDVDFCLQARAAGLRVTVRPIEVLHRAKSANEGYGDKAAWCAASEAIAAKWPAYVRPATPLELAQRFSTAARWRSGVMRRRVVSTSRSIIPSAHREPEIDLDFSAARQRIGWVQLYLPEGCILEIGCNAGEFLKVADEEGFDIFGVESNEDAAERARGHDVPVVSGSLSDWTRQYPGLRPDAICLWHSHQEAPGALDLLREMAATLTPGGHLFFEVPYAPPPDQMTDITSDGLRRLLIQAGLEPIQLLPLSRRTYMSGRAWRKQRNDALLQGRDWPSLDLLRGVARSPRGPSAR